MGNKSDTGIVDYATATLLLSVQNGEVSFLQFKPTAGVFWVIPKKVLPRNETSFSENLYKLSLIKDLTGWDFNTEPHHRDMVDLPDIAVSVCVVHIEDDSLVPHEHADKMRWTSFLSMMTPGGAEGSSQEDMEIVGAWLQNSAFSEMKQLLKMGAGRK